MKSLPTPLAFVSYSTVDRAIGGEVKALLEEYGLRCFLTHEDLEVSDEWAARILEELRRCDVLVVLLSKAFRESAWGPQEIGVVVGRGGVPIVPLSIDETIPFGFLSHIQSRRLVDGAVTHELLIAPMLRNFPRLILPGMVKDVVEAGSFRGAEAALKPLVPWFDALSQEELDSLVAGAIANGQVWLAGRCRCDYLPKLIATQRARITPEALRALEYQVEHEAWYQAAAS